MLIYVQEISERLIFTLDFVFTEHGFTYRLTNDMNDFLHEKGLKLNYSTFPFEENDFLTLEPSSLLFEEYFQPNTQLQESTWQHEICLEINHVTDPLAAIFYVLSRYEEYGEIAGDLHGRFLAKNSIQYKFNWLQIPVVDLWVWTFFQWINPTYLKDWNKQITCIPSFDIDNTFAYQWKEGWRSWLSESKDFVLKNNERRVERKAVQAGNSPDPYDCFEEITDVAQRFPHTKLFWLLGDFAKYDRNIAWNDPRHQRLIRTMNEQAQVGIHPSYKSNEYPGQLEKEIKRLSTILDLPVKYSRQHFLKLRFPKTYQELMDLGVQHDFTMGYAEEVGFRAGTANNFAFFNVETNCYYRNFRIHPFCYMDGTLLEYKKWTIDQAKTEITSLFEQIKRFGGEFCFIWHNETFAESGKWKGWKEVTNFSLELYETHAG